MLLNTGNESLQHFNGVNKNSQSNEIVPEQITEMNQSSTTCSTKNNKLETLFFLNEFNNTDTITVHSTTMNDHYAFN